MSKLIDETILSHFKKFSEANDNKNFILEWFGDHEKLTKNYDEIQDYWSSNFMRRGIWFIMAPDIIKKSDCYAVYKCTTILNNFNDRPEDCRTEQDINELINLLNTYQKYISNTTLLSLFDNTLIDINDSRSGILSNASLYREQRLNEERERQEKLAREEAIKKKEKKLNALKENENCVALINQLNKKVTEFYQNMIKYLSVSELPTNTLFNFIAHIKRADKCLVEFENYLSKPIDALQKKLTLLKPSLVDQGAILEGQYADFLTFYYNTLDKLRNLIKSLKNIFLNNQEHRAQNNYTNAWFNNTQNASGKKSDVPSDPDADLKQVASEFIENKRDAYDILKINRDATREEIKKAYYKIAVTAHPDKGGDPSAFRDATNAYHILYDQKARTYFEYKQKEASRATFRL